MLANALTRPAWQTAPLDLDGGAVTPFFSRSELQPERNRSSLTIAGAYPVPNSECDRFPGETAPAGRCRSGPTDLCILSDRLFAARSATQSERSPLSTD